jgi:hypothetical protein
MRLLSDYTPEVGIGRVARPFTQVGYGIGRMPRTATADEQSGDGWLSNIGSAIKNAITSDTAKSALKFGIKRLVVPLAQTAIQAAIQGPGGVPPPESVNAPDPNGWMTHAPPTGLTTDEVTDELKNAVKREYDPYAMHYARSPFGRRQLPVHYSTTHTAPKVKKHKSATKKRRSRPSYLYENF